jgi:thioredoxin 1
MTKITTDASFKDEILNSSKPVLVDFWAPWCGPCRQLSPIIDELSNDMANEIDIYKCNVDDNPEMPSQFMVRGIPSLMIFKDGKLADSKVGALPKHALIEWIKKTIA